MAKTRGVSLTTLADLRRAMGGVFNDLKADRINSDKARALATVANTLRAVIVGGDLEARVKALEEKLDG